MTYWQDQSIFFRLPLELRAEVYQYCQSYYMERSEVALFPYCMGADRDVNRFLQRRVSDLPGLLQTCKRIKKEAVEWLSRHIHIKFSDYSCWRVTWMYFYAVGSPDLSRVRMLTLSFEDLSRRPTVLLEIIEHIVAHAPKLQLLEITWQEMVYYPLWEFIEFEDWNSMEPWFPILAKARNLKTLRLKGILRQWAAAFEEYVKQRKPEVELDVELYDPMTSAWANWSE
ncbi:hypothetical protein K449DRAFT_449855 [Hypoxylon sp. EC38]|nr:hypothetical protein K449DRAFT_449855 [Hypoxylon sp. EC38]